MRSFTLKGGKKPKFKKNPTSPAKPRKFGQAAKLTAFEKSLAKHPVDKFTKKRVLAALEENDSLYLTTFVSHFTLHLSGEEHLAAQILLNLEHIGRRVVGLRVPDRLSKAHHNINRGHQITVRVGVLKDGSLRLIRVL